MKTLVRHNLSLLTCFLLASGCTQAPMAADSAGSETTASGLGHASKAEAPGTKPVGARLSTDEVLRIAEQAAIGRGVNLGDFKQPEAYYEFNHQARMWWVFFEGRMAAPGNHFSVSVDDRTDEARFAGGA